MNPQSSNNFPPVFYARFQVDKLLPEQIDELLANGWFRNDTRVNTAAAKYMGLVWRPSLMLRTPLENFTWKKSLRKLIRRNDRFFEVQIKPYQESAEKDTLWRKFKSTVHNWMLIPELSQHLFRERDSIRFYTWELCVYHGQQLVAFSIFDKGHTSIASLEAAYDPAFAKYSLGLYTMLMEIMHGINEGMEYYYPGFLPKDVSMFEYKLRPGNIEFFRLKEQKWVPWAELAPEDWLLETVFEKLSSLQTLCRAAGLISNIGYGFYEYRPIGEISPKGYNVFLLVMHPTAMNGETYLFACWDPMLSKYLLFSVNLGQPLESGSKYLQNRTLKLYHIPHYQWVGATAVESEAIDCLLNYRGDTGEDQGNWSNTI